ncbi:MAG TPA: heme ABC transporter ATP-binding protein [Acidimicrobiia bacterium]|nr:heme ABC transporter ATP-binding protein [Acidimicrobiia bacterium]
MIEATGLAYRVAATTLLTGVTLMVQPGEFVVVVGPNGAGKTTLLKLLAGDLRPSEGEVRLNGRPLDRYTHDDLAQQRSVFIQQTERDIPFTVRAVVAMGRYPHRHDASNSLVTDQEAIDRALTRTETYHLADRVFATLSSGEQTRVALARVFAQEAPLLLLDEPTTSLDLGHEERLVAGLRGLASEGRAVLAVLHDLNAAARHATRVVVVDHGELRADGTPVDVFDDGLLSSVYDQPMRVVKHPLVDSPLVLVVNHELRSRRGDVLGG